MRTAFRGIGLGLILLATSMGTARGAGCLGNCTIYCNGGAYYYYTTASDCCRRAMMACPGGEYDPELGLETRAEWWPVSCGYAQLCS